MRRDHFLYLIKVTVLAAVYFLTARFGLELNAVNHFATLVWPPTGIALAAIFIMGYRYWPGLLLAAILVNYVTGAPLLAALTIGIGNTLEAIVGAALLRRVGFQYALNRLRDVLGLILLAAIGSTSISAVIGTTSLLLAHIIHSSAYSITWFTWWIGDILGVLIMAPLLFVWSRPLRRRVNQWQIAEGSLLTLILIGIGIVIFRGYLSIGAASFTFIYAIFPILIWVTLRHGQRGGVTATFTVSLIVLWGTIISADHETSSELSHTLLLLQSFMGVTAITFMTMAAVVAERERIFKHQEKLKLRTAQLTKQRSHLLGLNKVKDEFISLASHQLRTPATGVKQYLGMVLDDYAGKLTKQQQAMVTQAYESNERQIKVINDLLNVAHIDAGTMELHLKSTDLPSLINGVLDEHATTFAARGQSVNFAHSSRTAKATIDSVKITSALENLIDNASKYSPHGTVLDVSLSKRQNIFAIAITDQGVGIAQKDFDRLFKKFSRIDNDLSVSAGGTGVGLYWVKKIVELHDGSVTVQSTPGKGSTFTIHLPAKSSKIASTKVIEPPQKRRGS